MSEKRYIIYNHTDGIPAGYQEWDTKEQAEECIQRMRDMFKQHQGYYSSVSYGRMNPDDVIYEIIEIDGEQENEE